MHNPKHGIVASFAPLEAQNMGSSTQCRSSSVVARLPCSVINLNAKFISGIILMRSWEEMVTVVMQMKVGSCLLGLRVRLILECHFPISLLLKLPEEKIFQEKDAFSKGLQGFSIGEIPSKVFTARVRERANNQGFPKGNFIRILRPLCYEEDTLGAPSTQFRRIECYMSEAWPVRSWKASKKTIDSWFDKVHSQNTLSLSNQRKQQTAP
ncbi:hypothetical protein VNO77_04358 [Canavalia gladiata]|uniref:Uncharacterized protein n=1 Tax=Canavalia gladiata TaxID=3824 RepID=A0AAN9N1H1_CANGL